MAGQQEFLNDVLNAGPTSDEWDYADTFSMAMLYLRNNGMLEARIATGEVDQDADDYRPQARRIDPYAA